jgi:hypothetical protein
MTTGLAQLKLEQDVAVEGHIIGRVGHLGPHVWIVDGETTATHIELATGACIVRDTAVQSEPSPLPEISRLGRGWLHIEVQPDSCKDWSDRMHPRCARATHRRHVRRQGGQSVCSEACQLRLTFGELTPADRLRRSCVQQPGPPANDPVLALLDADHVARRIAQGGVAGTPEPIGGLFQHFDAGGGGDFLEGCMEVVGAEIDRA